MKIRLLLLLVGILAVGAVGWVFWVNGQIEYYAHLDESRPADAIAIFGAAEYDGHPSPVFRARLDHGLALYRQGIAPNGGHAGRREKKTTDHSEGGVGHDYLLAHGVPGEPDYCRDAEQQHEGVRRKRLGGDRAGQSSAAHCGRERRDALCSGFMCLCAAEGLDVYTSPRPPKGSRLRSLAGFAAALFHEIGSYTAWRLHMH